MIFDIPDDVLALLAKLPDGYTATCVVKIDGNPQPVAMQLHDGTFKLTLR